MSTNIKAAVLIMMAMAMISSNDAIIKSASDSLSIGQILFVRGTLACLILGTVIKMTGRPIFPRSGLSRINLLRASLETTATLCFVTGLTLLPIATASTLVWTSPLLLTLFAAVFLKERVSRTRWMAVSVGFAGMLLVTQPFGAGFTPAMLLPLLAAVFVAARDVVTRHIDNNLHSFYITLATLVLVTLTGLVLSIFDWRPLEAKHLLMLSLSAALLTGGFFSQVTAIRMGELSFVAPFAFSGIIVALLLGFLIWNDQPTVSMLTGVALIAGSCIYIARSR
jgi:drug/metabolite transporter (DMT)-like permease